MNLGLIIPLANEEATIYDLCEDLKFNLNSLKIHYCIYFVLDNVSNDNTKEILKDYTQKNKSFATVLKIPRVKEKDGTYLPILLNYWINLIFFY